MEIAIEVRRSGDREGWWRFFGGTIDGAEYEKNRCLADKLTGEFRLWRSGHPVESIGTRPVKGTSFVVADYFTEHKGLDRIGIIEGERLVDAEDWYKNMYDEDLTTDYLKLVLPAWAEEYRLVVMLEKGER